MDPSQFVDSVREENETALSQLDSPGTLADEDGSEMDTDRLLRAAAGSAFHARKTFEEWADSAGNEAARETYETTAEEEGEQYGRLTRRLDGEHEPGDTPAIHEYLRDTTDTAGRAGAFVGWTIAAAESNDGSVEFFTANADPQNEQLFRDLGDDIDTQFDRGQELLSEVCATDDEWARAHETAGDTITLL
jgi:hypothetical protein